MRMREMGWECRESSWECVESGWKCEKWGESGWRCRGSTWKLRYGSKAMEMINSKSGEKSK